MILVCDITAAAAIYSQRVLNISMSPVDELILDSLWPLLLTWFNFNPSMDK